MAVPIYLLAFILAGAYACKSRSIGNPEDNMETHPEVTTDYTDYYEEGKPGLDDEDEDTEEDEEDAAEEESEEHPLKDGRYLALIQLTRSTRYSTGVRILPHVVTMPKRFAREDSADRFQVYYKNQSGEAVTGDGVSIHSTGYSESHWIVLLVFDDKKSGTVEYQTIPIVTRTDRYEHVRCSINAIDREKTESQFNVTVMDGQAIPGICRNPYRICAKPDERHCFDPMGSALICSRRLIGIRVDGRRCVDSNGYYLFSQLRRSDSYIISNILERSYYNYDVISDINRRSTGEVLSTSIIRITAVLLFLDIMK